MRCGAVQLGSFFPQNFRFNTSFRLFQQIVVIFMIASAMLGLVFNFCLCFCHCDQDGRNFDSTVHEEFRLDNGSTYAH